MYLMHGIGNVCLFKSFVGCVFIVTLFLILRIIELLSLYVYQSILQVTYLI